jgi:glycosyltransferase involved in cell wall biosynthesis
VLSQTFLNFELIIIDDASTDGSLQEILKFNDPRIRLFHRETPGRGGYAARNLGIREAKGEWVAFLDSDDEWLPDHLEKMTSLAKRFPDCDFLNCGWKTASAEGVVHYNRYYARHRSGDAHEITVKDYLQLHIRKMSPVWTGTVCLRNTLTAKDIFPEEQTDRGADQYAWLFYLVQVKKLAWSPHEGAIYYCDTINKVTNSSFKNINYVTYMYNACAPFLNRNDLHLLSRVYNCQIWDLWKDNIFRDVYQPFNLVANLHWKHDIIPCLMRVAVSLIPPPALRFPWRIKRNLKDCVEAVSSRFHQRNE